MRWQTTRGLGSALASHQTSHARQPRASDAHLLRLATLRHLAPALLLLRLFLRGLVFLLLASLTLRACALPGRPPSVSTRTCSGTSISRPTSKCLLEHVLLLLSHPNANATRARTPSRATVSAWVSCVRVRVCAGGRGDQSAENCPRVSVYVCSVCVSVCGSQLVLVCVCRFITRLIHQPTPRSPRIVISIKPTCN